LLQRTKLLPAYVEIMLATGGIEDARDGSHELAKIAESFDAWALGAMAAQARGAIELAAGDAQAALRSLRHAFHAWQQVEAPYEATRVRVLMAMACRAFGDDEGARLEFDAARAVFEQLGAAPELARLDSLTKVTPIDRPHGLTPRELQVLLLIASGKTNKAIAAELFLSERTVDRHVSNIFNKLDVPSRAAATAYAYEHQLI
jgi:DNA-binding NarL/FixJ family response regulator